MITDHISIMASNIEIEALSRHNEIIEAQNEIETLELCGEGI